MGQATARQSRGWWRRARAWPTCSSTRSARELQVSPVSRAPSTTWSPLCFHPYVHSRLEFSMHIATRVVGMFDEMWNVSVHFLCLCWVMRNRTFGNYWPSLWDEPTNWVPKIFFLQKSGVVSLSTSKLFQEID